ncbi:potassium transporter [Artemisia annua]|uniref:Potassium transporter n=1 Tax=Artemisia annua TaxID=35608 RepID=A0A2U1NEI2_ARTAN|nr:potassium transporter [Artemisia annua]
MRQSMLDRNSSPTIFKGTLATCQADERLTSLFRTPIHENSFAAKTKGWLRATALKKNALLYLLFGNCHVNVSHQFLSASGGLKSSMFGGF